MQTIFFNLNFKLKRFERVTSENKVKVQFVRGKIEEKGKYQY